MLYLINEEQRKKIVADYYARVGQVIVWFLIGIFIVIGIAALPTILLLQTEVRTSEQRIAQYEAEVAKAKAESTEEDAAAITNKLEILKNVSALDIRKKYIEIERVAEAVPGIKITSVTIDALSKKVQIITEVRDKDAAKELVDAFNKTTYKGANLPYSVLSEKASFIFAQNLSYE